MPHVADRGVLLPIAVAVLGCATAALDGQLARPSNQADFRYYQRILDNRIGTTYVAVVDAHVRGMLASASTAAVRHRAERDRLAKVIEAAWHEIDGRLLQDPFLRTDGNISFEYPIEDEMTARARLFVALGTRGELPGALDPATVPRFQWLQRLRAGDTPPPTVSQFRTFNPDPVDYSPDARLRRFEAALLDLRRALVARPLFEAVKGKLDAAERAAINMSLCDPPASDIEALGSPCPEGVQGSSVLSQLGTLVRHLTTKPPK